MPLYLPHFNLQDYNTLASPVFAHCFVSVHNEDELRDALLYAKKENLPLLILGGGSNIVLRDDFPGLVIHIQLFGKQIERDHADCVYVKAAAGENWQDLVEFCLDYHCWGLENLSLIPGTVGAAPIQNIGAYGVELKDVFSELTAINIQSGLPVTFTLDGCQFGYRDSIFKGALKDQYVITSVTLKLNKHPSVQTRYPALQQELAVYSADDITPQLISDCVCDIRRRKLPDPHDIPNVGSFFKNPLVSIAHLQRIQQTFADVVFYPVDDTQVKLPAGWLIERAGWKGVSEEGVAVHAHQALVLINPNRLRGDVVLQLADKIVASVQKTFGVELEQEPRVYP